MNEQTIETTVDDVTEDSSVIKAIRAENKKLQAQLDAATERAASFSQGKDEAVAELIGQLGHSKMKDIVAERVDGFPTLEKVQAVLADLGLTEAPASNETEDSTPPAPSVQQVAGLGQRAANAAGTGGVPDVDTRLATAESEAEVKAIMAELGASF